MTDEIEIFFNVGSFHFIINCPNYLKVQAIKLLKYLYFLKGYDPIPKFKYKKIIGSKYVYSSSYCYLAETVLTINFYIQNIYNLVTKYDWTEKDHDLLFIYYNYIYRGDILIINALKKINFNELYKQTILKDIIF